MKQFRIIGLVEWFGGLFKKGDEMGKAEFIAQKVVEVQAAQAQAVSDGMAAVWDEAVLEQPAPGGTLTQADVDAAVAGALADAKVISDKALSDAQALDAQALADAGAKAANDLAAVQQALNDMTAKEQLEEKAVADVQASIIQVQASFDAIKAILFPPAA